MKINTKIILIFIYFLSFPINAGTLDTVKDRGYLNCGVAENFPGFASLDDEGNWRGFDIDFCKAISLAIFNDSKKVNFVPTSSRSRFPLLALGEIDVLIRNTTWSYSRDVNLEFEFTGINFYDGQGFMVPTSFKINNISELDNSTICVVSGSSIELNIKYYFEKNNLEFKTVLADTFDESMNLYLNNNCDVLSGDLSVLSSSRIEIGDSNSHSILENLISKEPLGPLVRHNDSSWADLIRWTLNVLVIAEEKSINADNIDEMLNSPDPEVLRLLGEIGNYGDMMELDNKWAYNVIKELGNYSSIYEKNIGANTIFGTKRGLNNLWTNGGLLYSPPFK
ncbi:MAG: putative amino-acid ABC transporter-binding protein YhdW [Alphaproteobacteria bacterium MarineAlpha5_Bin12]|nr:MAG: putative amino-acid ABC transporter-binding protein YhdW [Alphaproteobacteria bacterium MarineAlpha5_Bin12]|tara:strand:- start:664 stop:1674 length:1011 start_codon:yes stop_codon:yes gene_type:complete